ncbi:hypothetical protein C5B32_13050 [Neisseria gonorrhoeae]|nr:hypothetical protein C5B32_13050 [Neisseria gonorrhoeae]
MASPKLSQYTLRYRYVTGSGLRPDTRKGQNQKRLAGGCAHCVITTTFAKCGGRYSPSRVRWRR